MECGVWMERIYGVLPVNWPNSNISVRVRPSPDKCKCVENLASVCGETMSETQIAWALLHRPLYTTSHICMSAFCCFSTELSRLEFLDINLTARAAVHSVAYATLVVQWLKSNNTLCRIYWIIYSKSLQRKSTCSNGSELWTQWNRCRIGEATKYVVSEAMMLNFDWVFFKPLFSNGVVIYSWFIWFTEIQSILFLFSRRWQVSITLAYRHFFFFLNEPPRLCTHSVNLMAHVIFSNWMSSNLFSKIFRFRSLFFFFRSIYYRINQSIKERFVANFLARQRYTFPYTHVSLRTRYWIERILCSFSFFVAGVLPLSVVWSKKSPRKRINQMWSHDLNGECDWIDLWYK